MTSEPKTFQPEPPAAKRIPVERTHHADTVIDDYEWLADRENPDTIAFLEAQNAYTEAMTQGQDELRAAIFDEIKGRTQETDLSVPSRKGDWWYYARTVEGKQYRLYCRRAAGSADERPPMTDDGSPLEGEQVLLDGNELAGDNAFFSMGTYDLSPDATKLAFSTNYTGDERFTLRIKDLVTGEVAADEIENTHYGTAWSLDGSALFYVRADEAWRPYQVWRHLVGTSAEQDQVVYTETDDRFFVGISLSRSERYLMLNTDSKLTSEVRLLDAASATGEFTVVAPRRQGLEYSVDHQVTADGTERLLILHNDGALNFELATATLDRPGDWTPLVPHRADTRLLNVGAFANHAVLYYRKDGLTGLRILRTDGSSHDLDFDEPVYTVGPGSNPDYASRLFRLGYVSLVTPDSVYDFDTVTGELTLLKRQPVLTLPGQPPYRIEDYEQVRLWAPAPDGTQVPISLVRRKDVPADGSAPLLLYGYGSYEISSDPYFAVPRLSLLDRGFIFAIAHIRGGGELGRHWYDDGKLLNKRNTFLDFIACAKYLSESDWTSPDRLIARGGSAGGLLMGAVANLAPEAFGAIVANVPFVDALNTILDPSLPLTVTEWEEWGDPLHDPAYYSYMKSYSPYENISADETYPPILAVTSLNDTRVRFTEPAKWIAKLQAIATGGPFLLKTEMIAGHGGRSGRYDAWREEAVILGWMITTAARAAQADAAPVS
ncbi:MAG TPA: S9 family peptidase [Streptosporangiaceae bacterium]|nr:S9 family peptidase [Streptosporangiaceae bacterium]